MLDMKKKSRPSPVYLTFLGLRVSSGQTGRDRAKQIALMCYAEEEDQKVYAEFVRCKFPY